MTAGARDAHGETILLVEDEDAVRSMAARILRRHGYEVIEAPGAEEALAAYRGLDRPPSLVLTDVAMPRMSGVELAARLGKSSPPVMFMSGYTDESVGDPDVLPHSAGFLHKPFSAAALLQRVGEATVWAQAPGSAGCAAIDFRVSDKILRMANETMTAELGSIDGRIAPSGELTIPATDEGLLRGDGVFEVIRVYDGTAFALAEHLDRLERSAANLRLPDVFRPELEGEIPELLEARGGSDFDGVLRIVVTRGGRRLLLTEQAAAKPPGVRLGIVIYAPTRVLDNIKSLSYGANMLTTRLAQERGFDEALLVTPHGRVLEAPTSTLFWVDGDGALCTPPLDEHILPSITRERLLRLLDVDERSCPTEDLLAASEAFLASTIREVQSIGAIEDTEYEEGPRTREAAAAFRAHVEEELGR